ncbi:methyl-accepting chemotaxis protein (MCP) signaling protein [Alicyclobacillus sacchari]|uniref:Methyl-accepting chemotaxis protein (MCP) signaling protein n=1 Tax=Alicyclobacillus sacchari TaxID=392010 RepID=A0A4R8LV37_9BACL|nr:methyl-accepting chemotaxis protein [Alicyclobacillus sacchari]TDY51428.1 methyl-accepting chemotaxis protein (MCP) signaling protein [Alicyclobacillus sacchari]
MILDTKGMAPSSSFWEYVQHAPHVPEVATGLYVRQLFEQTGSEAIVVCTPEENVVGTIVNRRFFEQIGQRFGADLYLGRPVSLLMDTQPLVVSVHTPAADVVDSALSRPVETFYDPVVVTCKGRYYGILTIRDLLTVSRNAQDQAEQMRKQALWQAKDMVERIQSLVYQTITAAEASHIESLQMTETTTRAQTVLDKHVSLVLEEFTRAAEQQTEYIQSLASRIDAIEGIADIISQFAGQSQLLTINAQIEAARAGNHGRGFAVIAHEISHLALCIRDHASQVSETIVQLVSYIERIVSFHETIQNMSAHTVGVIEEANRVLEQLFASVERQHENVQNMHAHIDEVIIEARKVTESIHLAQMDS